MGLPKLISAKHLSKFKKTKIMKSILTLFLIIGILCPGLEAQTDPPIGSIVIWAGPSSTIPNGWKRCNGEYLTKSAHPELSDVIQDYWGPYRQSAGTVVSFRLPDLRGVLLRGVNEARNDGYADPDAQNRNSSRGIPNEVGSFQLDAFQEHIHQVGNSSSDKRADSQPERTRFADFYPGSGGASAPYTSGATSQTTLGGVPRIASETRAKNAYVYYIIRVE